MANEPENKTINHAFQPLDQDNKPIEVTQQNDKNDFDKAIGHQITPHLEKISKMLSKDSRYAQIEIQCNHMKNLITNSPFGLNPIEENDLEALVQQLIKLEQTTLPNLRATLTDLRQSLSFFLK